MKQMQMHGAMKGFGTDLGKSEAFNMVGTQSKAIGWRMIGNEAEETDRGQIVYVKLRSSDLIWLKQQQQ